MDSTKTALRIGWGEADITPDQPVMLAGQFHIRVSEGVRDPVTATALALDGADEAGQPARLVLVSCDLVGIADSMRDQIRARVKALVPELDPEAVVLNATHTHTGPETRIPAPGAGMVSTAFPHALPAMGVAAYVELAADRIAQAVARAWQGRAPASIGWGLTHAVVGHNRRWCRTDGTSQMYGNTNTEQFSHIEGYEDHSVNVLGTWDEAGNLAGLVVNIACPSQETEGDYLVSADFWHDVRTELARRLGRRLPILAQCSAAGDQSPHHIINKAAEQRMRELRGLESRLEIARRLASATMEVLPVIEKARETAPVLRYRRELVRIPRRLLTEAEVEASLAEARTFDEKYATLMAELAADPAKAREPRWYVGPSAAYRRARWLESVQVRYRLQQEEPELPVEVHAVRLGNLALATNPFEYYLDFGMHIKARSPATQTFLVQLAGSGTYLAPSRSLAGGSYGAVPASTVIGPEGGQVLARRTVELLGSLWPA